MEKSNTLGIEFPGLSGYFTNYKKLPLTAISIFVFVTLIFFYFGVYLQNHYYTLGIICGFILIYFFIKYPRFWLYSITLSLTIFFRNSGEGVSVLDVISGFLFVCTLFSWLFWQIAIKRRRLVTNLGDWFILAFFILLLGNSIIAVVNGITFFDWLREYSIMALILYYFPFRYYFNEEKYLKRFLILFAIVCSLTALQQFYDYYKLSLVNIVYAYQILYTRNINQTLFTSASAFGILFLIFEKKFSRQLVFMLFTIISTIALVSSFSRTFWIILIFEVIIFFILLPVKYKVKLATYLVIFSSAFALTVLITFKGGAFVALKAIERRLETSTKGRKDPSVQARLAEYKVVLSKISEFPMGGNGLVKKFSFMNPIKKSTTHTNIIHNGYLFLFYRIGIPLSLFYMFFLLYFLFKSFKMYYKSKINLYRILALGSFCCLLVIIISGFSTTQLHARDGVFVMAFAFAFTQIAEKKLIENKK